MRSRVRPAWSSPCCEGIAEALRGLALQLGMLLWWPSLALIPALERSSGEVSVDGHAVVRFNGVAGGASIICPILV